MAWKDTDAKGYWIFSAGIGDSRMRCPDTYVTVNANGIYVGIELESGISAMGITPTQARDLAALLIEAAKLVEGETS